MTGLAVLLLVQGPSDSFAAGGVATGSYVAGLAGVAPAIGRIIDRHGPRLPLVVCALLFPTSLAALVVAVAQAMSQPVIMTCAFAGGASFPPITVCMRTYLRQRIGDEARLATAYSVDSILIELVFIVGPLLVALLFALSGADMAVWFAGASGLIGALLFWRSPALAAWSIEPRRDTTLLGPLGEKRFVALMGIVACYAIAFGLSEIGVAAYAAEGGTKALAGLFLGLMSAGSASGGFLYGSRGWHAPLLRQSGLMLTLMGAGLALLGAPWSIIGFSALCVLAGVVMAPALIIQSMLVAKMANAAHTTEAFTWSTTALLAGVGVGMACGGMLIEWRSSSAAFYVA